jgi:hypothetical protein
MAVRISADARWILVGLGYDCLDDGVNNFSTVHGNADVVADFVGFGRLMQSSCS